MLFKLLVLLNLISAKELIQHLVFGNDEKGHFCDFRLEPSNDVAEVTIFEVVDDKNDNATPRVRLIPTGSEQSNGYSRIEIPSDLAVYGKTYSFRYSFIEGGHAFSENWTFDPDRDQFALSSAVTKKIWRDTRFQVAAGITVALVICGVVSAMYRKMSKSRNTL